MALACLGGNAYAQGDKVQTIGKGGLKSEGKIEATDNKVEVMIPGLDKTIPMPAKLYNVKLKGGTKYQMDMVSDDLDAFLVVQDAGGKQLAFDDDSGGKLNARLEFTPTKDGNYKVYAASLRGTGNFSLSIKAAGGGGGNGGGKGDGKVHEVGKKLTIKGEVSRTDPKVKVVVGAKMGQLPAKMYLVKLKGGTKYKITMSSEPVDSFLVVQDATGKQLGFDDDSGGGTKGLDAQLELTAPKDGNYKIYAAALIGQGAFTLTVEPVGGEEVRNAVPGVRPAVTPLPARRVVVPR